MNISVIGTGYVGLTTGACLAEVGMNVLCMDADEEKIINLKKGNIPIYEPGLEEIVKKNLLLKVLNFTNDMEEAVKHGDIIFLAVGTPALEDDSADLSNIYKAATSVAEIMDANKIIVVKSTVPIGTSRRIKDEMQKILDKNNKKVSFDIVSNPEFLRQGSAIDDFFIPDRVVIGTENPRVIEIMKKIYHTQEREGVPIIISSMETSEMIKYASNAFLATKISFINEISNMCELCGSDVVTVSKAMGLDGRIGPAFLNPGPGFGGSCFPKDTKALVSIGREIGYIPQIVESSIRVNEAQYRHAIKKIHSLLGGIENMTISILGASFKPNTDDIREAPSLNIIKELLKNNALVKIYDPKALVNIEKVIQDTRLELCKDIYSACFGSDCILLLTEWEEFKYINFNKIINIVNKPAFVDMRNFFEPQYIRSFGFSYEGVGRK